MNHCPFIADRFAFAALLVAVGLVLFTPRAMAGNGLTYTTNDLNLPVERVGMFIGKSGDAIVAGGGLDAAGRPSHEVFIRVGPTLTWSKLALPLPLAFTACVSGADGRVYLAGGISEGGATNLALAGRWLAGAGTLEWTPLPALPASFALAGAGIAENKLYVVGGVASLAANEAGRDLYELDLKNAAAGWRTLPPMPGPGRALPGVLGLHRDILVFGGFTVAQSGEVNILTPTDSSIAYRVREVDGTTYTGWRTNQSLPLALAAPVLQQTGHAHMFVGGGIMGALRGDLLAALNRCDLSRRVFAYHAITDTWVEKDPLPSGVALASALPLQPKEFLIAGGAVGLGASGPLTVSLQSTIRGLTWLDWAIIVLYLVAMALFGLYYSGRQETSAQYALGNRTVPWWAAGISMFATGASSISIIAIPAQAFQSNLIWAFPTLLLIPLYFLEAHVIYPLIRRLEITSTYEYLGRRFHPGLRYLASAQCIALQLFGRMNIVMLLPALVIAAVCKLDIFLSVALMGFLTTIYTALGGFKAVIWTDVVQGFLKFFAVVLIVVVAIGALPHGWTDFVKTSVSYQKFDYAIWSLDYTLPIFWIAALTPLMTKLAFAADQPVVQRVFATPLKDVRKLAFIFLVCSVLISLMVNFAGISMFSYFHCYPEKMDMGMANDQVLPMFVAQSLPVGVVGLIIACLFAAAMATLSSSMNSVATIFMEDFYRVVRKDSSDRERLLVMKVAAIVTGVFGTGCALYMAKLNVISLFKAWNELLALLGGGFLGIYILGIFTRRSNAIGAVAGTLGSIATTIWIKQYTEIHWYAYMPAAVVACVVIGYVVSVLTPAQSRDLTGLTVFDMKEEGRRLEAERIAAEAAKS